MSNDKSVKIKGNTPMEITKISASLLVTVVLAFGAFMLQTGIFRNELKNVKENQLVIKKDLKEDINNKADQKVVDLIFEKINGMDKKLDRIIENKLGENK